MKDPDPFYESALVFPLEPWHNHASCIVELPNGDLLLCWFHGSGEREADDVMIEGARFKAGGKGWSRRFLMADTPDYPDCNPCMFLDPRGRLWLVYATILANEWHTALLKYHVSSDCQLAMAPHWELTEVLHITPGEEFVTAVNIACDAEAPEDYLRTRRAHAADKLYRRLGWMPRAHATLLEVCPKTAGETSDLGLCGVRRPAHSGGRIVLPLYSDGFHFSLMALSDDAGMTWHTSHPIISVGGIQPTVVERSDGSLVAYMRDNGPPPKRVMVTESRDRGETWSRPIDTDIPNPGSGLEVIRLRNGHWLMVCNDTEKGRHRLTIILSQDEGKTWTHKRCLEDDSSEPDPGSYSYPSVIESMDGTIHVSYSYHVSENRKSIKWAHFNEEWVLAGCKSSVLRQCHSERSEESAFPPYNQKQIPRLRASRSARNDSNSRRTELLRRDETRDD